MLDAAEKLVIEVGTHRTTLKEVGENAGYSRGLAHARFGNKETLFIRLAQRCFENWLATLQAAGAGKQGLSALLSRLDAVLSYATQHPDDARVLYILWFESVGLSSPMQEQLDRFHKAARQDIVGLLGEAQELGEVSRDVDAQGFALHLTSTFFGLSYQWIVSPEAVDVEAAVTLFKDFALKILEA